MADKPKLFIHIGTHKTGTTSIQSFLSDNRDLIQKNGILTPKMSIFNDFLGFDEQLFIRHHTSAEEIIYQFIKDRKAGYFVRDIGYYEARLTKKIQRELLSKNKDVIFSSESFFDNHLVRFDRRMDLLAGIIGKYREKYEIKIIIYFRAQDSFIESMFMMYGIICSFNLDFQTFLKELYCDQECETNTGLSLDWQIFTDCIKRHFPDSEVIVRSYEQASKNNLIKDFTAITGLSALGLKPSTELKNVGLNRYGMYVLTHADFLSIQDKEILFRAIWMDDSFKKKEVGEKYHLLSYVQRMSIYRKYYQSNQRLFGFSDDEMLEFFYPNGQADDGPGEVHCEKKLFEQMIRCLVSIQKKTLIIKLLFLRKKTIDRVPPALRFAIIIRCQPLWEALCRIYWMITRRP